MEQKQNSDLSLSASNTEIDIVRVIAELAANYLSSSSLIYLRECKVTIDCSYYFYCCY
jgi:hypothetical protein